MKVEGYLIIGNNKSCRFVKSRVGLNWNEISVKVNIELPDSLFRRPMLEANIKLDGEFEHKFDMEIQKNLQDIINQNKNMHLVNINILPKDADSKEEK